MKAHGIFPITHLVVFAAIMVTFGSSCFASSTSLVYIYQGAPVLSFKMYTTNGEEVASDGSTSVEVEVGHKQEVASVKLMTNYDTETNPIRVSFTWTDMVLSGTSVSFPVQLFFNYTDSNGEMREEQLVSGTAYSSFFSNPGGRYVEKVIGMLYAEVSEEDYASAMVGDYAATVTLGVTAS